MPTVNLEIFFIFVFHEVLIYFINELIKYLTQDTNEMYCQYVKFDLYIMYLHPWITVDPIF